MRTVRNLLIPFFILLALPLWAQMPETADTLEVPSGRDFPVPAGTVSRESVDSLEFHVYFYQDKSDIRPEYRSNHQQLDLVVEKLGRYLSDPNLMLMDITITAGASPEGTVERNRNLAINRARSIQRYLQDALRLRDSFFILNPLGEDWDYFRQMLLRLQGPRWEDVLKIIDELPETPADTLGQALTERELRIKALDGWKTWNWYLENYFPEVRGGNSGIKVHFLNLEKMMEQKRREAEQARPQEPAEEPDMGPEKAPDVSPQAPEEPAEPAPEAARNLKEDEALTRGAAQEAGKPSGERLGRYQFAVKTNLLFDAVLCPNIEVEFPIGNRFSLMLDHNFPWFLFTSGEKKHAYEFLHTGLEGRLWLDRKDRPVLSGFFLGVYASTGKFDFEHNSWGYQCRRYYSGGVSGGYSMKIARDWRLELSLAIGYAHLDMQKYEQIPISLLVWRRDTPRNWFGPTKAKVSISWLIPSSLDRQARKEAREQKKLRKSLGK